MSDKRLTTEQLIYKMSCEEVQESLFDLEMDAGVLSANSCGGSDTMNRHDGIPFTRVNARTIDEFGTCIEETAATMRRQSLSTPEAA